MITLIMLTNQLRNSGPNRVMLDIARKLDRNKITPVVIALMPDDTVRPIASEFEKIGVEIHRFAFSKWDLEIKTRVIGKKIEEFIKSNYSNPIVQAHGYHPTLLTSKMMVPHTATIHCIASEDFIDSKGRLLGSYMVWRFMRHLRRHKYPVAISKYMMDYYSPVCGARLRLIHNGVNFEPWLCDEDELKRKLNLPGDKKIIVIPGSITSRKNSLHTIKQLRKMRRDDFVCVFLGFGPQLEMLKTETEGDYRFRFEGYKPNVREYLACAHLYISSSLSEGLPLATLEALCMGVPALLSSIPPHREIAEILKQDSVRCFSLQSNQLSELANDFLDAKHNRRHISESAIINFSSQAMAKKYEQLFDDMFKDQ